MKVILDTNFFLIPEKFKVDLFKEFNRIIDEKYTLVTVEPVIEELNCLSEGNGKDARAARVGLKLFKGKDLKVLKTKEGNADKAILELSEKISNCAVATLDKDLRIKSEKRGAKTIYLRSKNYLVLK